MANTEHAGSTPDPVDRPLVRRLFERLYRRRQPPALDDSLLPVLAIIGPAGSGKTETLNALERRCVRLPYARYDVPDEPETLHRWHSILTVVCDQLRQRRPRVASRPLLPRHDLADRINQLGHEQIIGSGQPMREHLLDELGKLLLQGRLRRPRRQILRRLRGLGKADIATRPTRVRRLLLGHSLHTALSWYEEQRANVGADGKADGLAVAERMVRVLRSDDRHTAEVRARLDKLRVDAFRADLRRASTRRRLGVPRSDRYVVFIDNVHRLAGPSGEDLLTAVLDSRNRSGPDPLLLVVTTEQRLADDASWDGPPAIVPNAASLDDADAALRHWRARVEAPGPAGAAGPADPPVRYLPVWLRGFTVEETRAFLDSRNYRRLEQSTLFESLQHATGGHPLALELLGRATEAGTAPQPVRAVFDERCPLDDDSTIAECLLAGLTRHLPDAARRHLGVCCAPLQADVATLAVALGPAGQHQADELWRQYARSACAEVDPSTAALVFHPLLRELQARVLAAGGAPDADHAEVHERLRRHFEQRLATGDETARRDVLYHTLALGELDRVVDHLDRRLRAGDHTWLTELNEITWAPAAPAREWVPPGEGAESSDPRDSLHTLVSCLWRQRSATVTARISADLLWDTCNAFLDLGAHTTATDAIDHCKDQASRFHELYRIATGEEVRPPLPPQLRPEPVPYRPRRVWPYRIAQATAASLAVAIVAYLGTYVPLWLDTHGCDAPAVWSVGKVTGARFRHSGLYATGAHGDCAGLGDAGFAFGSDPAADRVQAKIKALNDAVADGTRRPLTVVVLTTLNGGSDPQSIASRAAVAAGVSGLQGVYLAMAARRSRANSFRDVRILVADLGTRRQRAKQVVQQIVNTAEADSTIVAGLDVGLSREVADDAIRSLNAAGIPVLTSATAGDDGRSGSGRLFRLAPTGRQQTRVAVADLEARGIRTVALLESGDDPYGRELARAFTAATKDRPLTVIPSSYPRGDPRTAVNETCNRSIKTIYLAGRVTDMAHALDALSTSPECAGVQVMGGQEVSLLAALGGGRFPRAAAQRLRYTASAPEPDEARKQIERDFFAASAAEFGALPDPARSPGGCAEFAALAHDAMATLLEVFDYLPRSNLADDFVARSQPRARDAVTAELRLLHDVRLGREPSGEAPLTGVSGPIDFGPHSIREHAGDPFDKQVLVKLVGPDLLAHTVSGSAP